MNCREYERAWDELLDAPPPGPSDLERAMEAHASDCGACRVISSRYQVLRQAASAWTPTPAPSAGSLERLYALKVPATRPTIRLRRPPIGRLIPLATAAALLAMAWAGWSARSTRPTLEVSKPAPPVATSRDSRDRPLGRALAEATEATIDLAREASAPAARIGREILDLGRLKGLSPAEKPDLIDADEASASDLIRAVGERVNAGVRPISGSARHAFGFLLGPPAADDPAPADSRETF